METIRDFLKTPVGNSLLLILSVFVAVKSFMALAKHTDIFTLVILFISALIVGFIIAKILSSESHAWFITILFILVLMSALHSFYKYLFCE